MAWHQAGQQEQEGRVRPDGRRTRGRGVGGGLRRPYVIPARRYAAARAVFFKGVGRAYAQNRKRRNGRGWVPGRVLTGLRRKMEPPPEGFDFWSGGLKEVRASPLPGLLPKAGNVRDMRP